MIIHNDRLLGVTRHSSVREHGAMGSNKPHKQDASQRPTKIRYLTKFELCCRSMWCINYNLRMRKARRHHFLPLPKRPRKFSWNRLLVLNPTLTGLLNASRTRKGGTKAPSLVSLSESVEGGGEETYCRADENCSFEALLCAREKSPVLELCPVHVCAT